MDPAMNEIVQVENIVKDFRPGFGLKRKRVLHGISFKVRDNEIFGFVGPNGAGKTTTLKLLMGLIRPTSGEASILGHAVRETAFRREIGFLPESPYFYGFLTGREILDFYAKLSGVTGARRAARVDELLDWVGLADAAGSRLQTYSKGMLQRLGIAQALVHDPKVVFLDEPMSGIDPIGRVEIRDLILRLRAEGKTVFMNTHILHDVEMVCDRVAIIVGGRIRYEGGVDEVVVFIEVAGSVRPKTDARTAVRAFDALGAMYVDYVPGRSDEELRDGQIVNGSRDLALMETAANLSSQATDVLTGAGAVLSERTASEIHETLDAAQRAMNVVAQLGSGPAMNEATRALSRLASVAERLDTTLASPDLARSVAQLDEITDNLNEMVIGLGEATGALARVMERIEADSGTFGRLVNDTALYHEVMELTTSMRLLLDDMRERPGRYFQLRVF